MLYYLKYKYIRLIFLLEIAYWRQNYLHTEELRLALST